MTVPPWHKFRADTRNPTQGAARILERLAYTVPPFPVEEIAARLGVEIVKSPSIEIAGSVHSTENTATITVRSTDAHVRQRFTVAHELGHLMLHPLSEEHRDQSFRGSTKEVQANIFAASLLMPLWMVEAYAPKLRYNGQALCQLFDVSDAAMAIRLKQLIGVPVKYG